MDEKRLTIGGQAALRVDEGWDAGYQHVFDDLRVAGVDDEGRRVRVLLPRSYEAAPDRRYPVVYLNDGENAFYPNGLSGKSWQVQDRLAELYADGGSREVIVVAVDHRVREYEYLADPDSPLPFIVRKYGGLADYCDYLADPLKGFVDAHYRTLPEPGTTAVVGSSHGGLAAFVAAARRRDAFGNGGALSPSFWTGNLNPAEIRASRWFKLSKRGLEDRTHRPRLWICWGLRRDGDPANRTYEAWSAERSQALVTLLLERYGYEAGRSLFTLADPLGGHDEDAWSYRFGQMLRAFRL